MSALIALAAIFGPVLALGFLALALSLTRY